MKIEPCSCGNIRIEGNECSRGTISDGIGCWEDDNYPTCLKTLIIECLAPGCCNLFLKNQANSSCCSKRCGNRARARRRVSTWSPTPEWYVMREAAWKKSQGICYLCGLQMFRGWKKGKDLQFTVEHIVPTILGGTDEISNLNGAHWLCNKSKYTTPLVDLTDEWKEKKIQEVKYLLHSLNT